MHFTVYMWRTFSCKCITSSVHHLWCAQRQDALEQSIKGLSAALPQAESDAPLLPSTGLADANLAGLQAAEAAKRTLSAGKYALLLGPVHTRAPEWSN